MLNAFMRLSTTDQLLAVLVVLVAAGVAVVLPVYLADHLAQRRAREQNAGASRPHPHAQEETAPVPDPTLAHPQPPATLYDRLTRNGTDVGVFATVTTMQIDRLLGPVGSDPAEAGDPLLLPYFRKPDGDLVDRPKLERHVTAFLMQALGGPKGYSGRAMEHAHAPGHPGMAPTIPITDEAFDRFVGHVAGVLTDLEVPAEWIAEVGTAVAPLRAAIVQV